MNNTFNARHRILCLLFFSELLCCSPALAGSEITAVNGSFLLLREPCSVFATPLVGMDTDQIYAGLSHGNRYHVKGLSAAELAVAFPLPGDMVLVTGFRRFGGVSYSEDKAVLAMCRPFGEQWYGAVSMMYSYTRFGNTDAVSRVMNASVAVKYRAGNEFDIGFQVTDVFTDKQHINKVRETPVVMVGGEYHPGNVRIAVSVTKQPGLNPSVIAALRYRFSERLCIMSGVSTVPAQLGFGFMLTFGKWNVTCAGSLHHVLGVSRNLTINIRM